MSIKDVSSFFHKIISGDRVALGQAMTLIESDRPEDRIDAIQLLELCTNSTIHFDKSVRITISGAPGVGKSTLIENLGMKAISEGHKVGVITIDPTSNISQGSILGDKSRMPKLSSSGAAFIRSSAAGSVLGGIGRRSFELMSLLEAVGYDLIFLETVGVGQSEHASWQLTDGFVLVIQPGSGDELQGIKRGITELADIVVINKADGILLEPAKISKQHYQNAIHYLASQRTNWTQKVLVTSYLNETGIDDFWEVLRSFISSRQSTGRVSTERELQNQFWLNWTLGLTAHQLLFNHPAIQQEINVSSNLLQTHKTNVFKSAFEIEEMMKQLIAPSTPDNT